MQELWDTMTRPNLQIIGIDEGEESQVKGIDKIFKRTIVNSFQNNPIQNTGNNTSN